MGKLIWLASYPKSGNTWLRTLLHNYLCAAATPYDINQLTDITTGESGASLYRRYDPRPASQYSIAEVQRMRPLVHADLTRTREAPVFVKTHNASVIVAGVPLVTPQLTEKAIYILRDPRDVAVSYSRHRGYSIDETIDFMADPDAATGGDDDKVYEHLGSWSIHVHFWTRRPSPRLLVLRYEDLLAAPHEMFGGVVRFLGGVPEPELLDRAIRFSAFEELSGQERHQGFLENPSSKPFFGQGRAGVWQDALKPSQAARIEAAHAVEMQRFGYL
ncbi:MAG TPA: sulfotransferase domain-containing protein [Stellaceae bacterium]|nr:sulfotransferase domain-containing protein [Stellaceae bacterium]